MFQYIITLANSVIGVSVLALPFCFQQCGIVLATLMLIFGAIMTRIVCHFLLKGGIVTRRRTYELLAYHTYGPTGKLLAELTIIGFLLGTLIAFLVVMGDLGPQILAEIFDIDNNSSLRTIVMTGLALFIALPLGLLKNIDSLGSVSVVTLIFYVILVCKILASGVGPLWAGSCLNQLNYWRPAGILQCIPIFAMALSCQTQIFPIYDSLSEPSLSKMNSIVKNAVYMCTGFYFSVGFFGYVAFCSESVGGNILVNFKPTWSTQFIKCCFVFSIAFSVPLVVLPCRASLHSMIWRDSLTYHHLHENSSNYIPEGRLRLLTVAIIASTLVIGLMIPNIELVLGLVGSTAGSIICIIFPALMFISITPKNTTEKLVARAILVIGIIILILTTYATLYAVEKASVQDTIKQTPQVLLGADILANPLQDQINAEKENAKIKLANFEKLSLKPDLSKQASRVSASEMDAAKSKQALVPPEIQNSNVEVPEDSIVAVPKQPIVPEKPVDGKQNVPEKPKPAIQKLPETDEQIPEKAEIPAQKPQKAQQLELEKSHDENVVELKPEPEVQQVKPEPNLQAGNIPGPDLDRKLPAADQKLQNISSQSSSTKPVNVKPAEPSPKPAVAEELLKALEQQQKEQRRLIEEQKQVLEELKKHHEEHDQAELNTEFKVTKVEPVLTAGVVNQAPPQVNVNQMPPLNKLPELVNKTVVVVAEAEAKDKNIPKVNTVDL